MKKFVIREMETVKTTAACYCCGCPLTPPCLTGGFGG
jgi:hypothetical protein